MPKFVKLPVSEAVIDTERITGYQYYFSVWQTRKIDSQYGGVGITAIYNPELGAYDGWVLAIYMFEGQTIYIQYENCEKGNEDLPNVEKDIAFLQQFLTIAQEE